MNKFLIGIGVFIALLVAAIIVGPGFVDWNKYKVDLTEQAERLTGRKLVIDGNIEISIFPAPALVANDVRLSNVEGARAENMVSLRSLQVHVALGPLLGGQVKVQSLQLVDPVIQLERFADGRTNVEIALAGLSSEESAPESSPEVNSAPSGSSPAQGEDASFGVDNFIVDNATVIFRDAVSGTTEKIEMLNATFTAASLEGPFESSGSLVVRDFPLNYDVSVGKIIEQRTAPVSLTISLKPGETKTTLSGAIIGMNEIPAFKGLIRATGNNLAVLVQSIGPRGGLPGMLGQNFGVEGEVEVSAKKVDIANLKLSLGNAEAKGAGGVELGDITAVNLNLDVDSVDFDKWLALPDVERAVIQPPISVQEKPKDGTPSTTVSLDMPTKMTENQTDAALGGFPTDIDATL
ncbi:MAG TPA: AsmA family protein, partial [Rhodospirillales bacterium]|nr:AsmA family protein [Rhodospirillales bacterium]